MRIWFARRRCWANTFGGSASIEQVDGSEFEADLGKLSRWFDQTRARDYFGVAQAADATRR